MNTEKITTGTAEIRKRKKRFWGFFLTLAMIVTMMIPVLGDSITVDNKPEGGLNVENDRINSGESISHIMSNLDPAYDGGYDVAINYKVTLHGDGTVQTEDLPPSETKRYEDDDDGRKKLEYTVLSRIHKGIEIKSWKFNIADQYVPAEYYYHRNIKEITLTADCWPIIYHQYEGEYETGVSNPTYYNEGKGVDRFNPVKKDGYEFQGWYSNGDFTEEVTSINKEKSGAIELYAKFAKIANIYNITYHEVDGLTNDNPGTYTEGGEAITLKAPGDKTGHTFKSWHLDSLTGSEVTKIENLTSNVNLYAEFTPNKYNITYVLNGGSEEVKNPETYTYRTGVRSFSRAVKAGCKFLGWVDDDGKKVDKITETDLGDKTLYAWFEGENPVSTLIYDISYELDGGTNGEGNPKTYKFGIGVESFADAKKDGYEFQGWYSDKFTQKVTSISNVESGDKVLYAKFARIYNITYHEVDGLTNDNPGTYTEGGEAITLKAPGDKTGHTFKSWHLDALTGSEVTKIENLTSNVNLYAKFTPNEYNITYFLNGGSGNVRNPEKYTYGTGVGSFLPAEKPGCKFLGWVDADYKIVDRITATDLGDKTLYAWFEGEDPVNTGTYAIRYELDGGTNGEGNPESYKYGTGVKSFADAKKDGYRFEGWYSDPEFKEKVTGISAEQKGEVVLYAKFSLEYDGMFKAIISKRTKNSLTVEWSRLPEADGYKIYSAHCFTGMKFYKEVTDPQETTLVREGLKEGHYYKFRIKAYKLVNGKKKKIGKTNTVHATTSNNAIYSVSKTPEIISIGGKSIEPVTRTSLEMAVGQKTRVKIREVSEEDNKTVQDHHGFHFFSNDKNVAKVSKGGRIKARSKGECRIYCFAQNGYFAIVDLTVK